MPDSYLLYSDKVIEIWGPEKSDLDPTSPEAKAHVMSLLRQESEIEDFPLHMKIKEEK